MIAANIAASSGGVERGRPGLARRWLRRMQPRRRRGRRKAPQVVGSEAWAHVATRHVRIHAPQTLVPHPAQAQHNVAVGTICKNQLARGVGRCEPHPAHIALILMDPLLDARPHGGEQEGSRGLRRQRACIYDGRPTPSRKRSARLQCLALPAEPPTGAGNEKEKKTRCYLCSMTRTKMYWELAVVRSRTHTKG